MKLKTKLHRVATTLALILMYSGVSAETIYYPDKPCKEILGFEFSSGNGDTSINQVDILCRDAEGKYTGYVGSWTNVAGIFGLGRVSTPDRFEFVPYGEDTVTVAD
jgi:hypothetical protein